MLVVTLAAALTWACCCAIFLAAWICLTSAGPGIGFPSGPSGLLAAPSLPGGADIVTGHEPGHDIGHVSRVTCHRETTQHSADP